MPKNTWTEQLENIRENELFDSYRKQNEQALFNSTIQTENAMANANRYMQGNLNAQGYGSQGYGANQQIASNNAYANALGEARKSYLDTAYEIDQKQQNAYEEDMNSLYNDMSTAMQSALSTGQTLQGREAKLNELVKAGILDEDYNITSEARQVLTTSDIYNLQNEVDYINQYGDNKTFNSLDDLRNSNEIIVYSQGNKAWTAPGSNYSNELTSLGALQTTKQLKSGDVIRLERDAVGANFRDSIYLMWDGQKYINITKDQFDGTRANDNRRKITIIGTGTPQIDNGTQTR